MWRYWICASCKLISGHPCTYCPNCPGRMVRVDDTYSRLKATYPGTWQGGTWRDAEDLRAPWYTDRELRSNVLVLREDSILEEHIEQAWERWLDSLRQGKPWPTCITCGKVAPSPQYEEG